MKITIKIIFILAALIILSPPLVLKSQNSTKRVRLGISISPTIGPMAHDYKRKEIIEIDPILPDIINVLEPPVGVSLGLVVLIRLKGPLSLRTGAHIFQDWHVRKLTIEDDPDGVVRGSRWLKMGFEAPIALQLSFPVKQNKWFIESGFWFRGELFQAVKSINLDEPWEVLKAGPDKVFSLLGGISGGIEFGGIKSSRMRIAPGLRYGREILGSGKLMRPHVFIVNLEGSILF